MNDENDLRTTYFECQCRSPEHTIRFWYDAREVELSTEVQLNHYLPWWKRVLAAVKYVFGISTYPHFDSFIMKSDDVERLMKLCQEYRIAELDDYRKKIRS